MTADGGVSMVGGGHEGEEGAGGGDVVDELLEGTDCTVDPTMRWMGSTRGGEM